MKQKITIILLCILGYGAHAHGRIRLSRIVGPACVIYSNYFSTKYKLRVPLNTAYRFPWSQQWFRHHSSHNAIFPMPLIDDPYDNQYAQQDQRMCELLDTLCDPRDSQKFSEIRNQVNELDLITSRHPELVTIFNEKSGLELLKSFQELPYTKMPVRFAEKKRERIDDVAGMFPMTNLGIRYRNIIHKFWE